MKSLGRGNAICRRFSVAKNGEKYEADRVLSWLPVGEEFEKAAVISEFLNS